MDKPRIFIQIASYRDEELSKTIDSCLAQATHPERLTFGICSQYDVSTEHLIDGRRSDDRFKIHDMPWRQARGAGLARGICNSLYGGEEFTLQIDSHMRFSPGWDEELIAQWRSCGDKKAVLSAHPHSFHYTDDGHEVLSSVESVTSMPVVSKFFAGDIPIIASKAIKNNPESPRLGYFVVGGVIFGPGSMCVEVPYEKDIAFMGEEIIHSLRLFTHGYTIYRPATLGIFHLYERPGQKRYWVDMTADEEREQEKIYHELTKQSYELVRRILNGESTQGLGVKRSLQEFGQYVGIDFAHKLIHPAQQEGAMPPVAQDSSWVEERYPAKERRPVIDVSDQAWPEMTEYTLFRVRIKDAYDVELHEQDIVVSDIIETPDSTGRHELTVVSRGIPAVYTMRPLTQAGVWLNVVDMDELRS